MGAGSLSSLLERGLELHRLGSTSDAEHCYRQVLGAEPRHAQAMFLVALLRMGEHDDGAAAELLERALEVAPNHPAFHANLGLAYRRLGRLPDSARALRRALELKPDLVEALFNLGLTLEDLGEFDAAIRCFERACELRTGNHEFELKLASALRGRAALVRSIVHFERALTLAPDSVATLIGLGSALHAAGRREEAHALHTRALELAPKSAGALESHGILWLDEGELDLATECFERALALDPELQDARTNLGHACKAAGLLEHAIEHYERVLAQHPRDHHAHSSLLYTMSFDPRFGARDLLDAARRWGREQLERTPAPVHRRELEPERRLRIGYVSPDFRNHCQALFTLPLLRAHDRERFEVFCYSDAVREDAVSAELASCASAWRRTLLLGDGELERLVAEDSIDILVDLTMHMGQNRLRLFGRRAAPLQLSWLAYPGTSGVDAIDYRITDHYLDPPGPGDDMYVERSLRLQHSFWCYDPLTRDPQVSELPARANGHVTFGCLNNFCKVNPRVLALWARVLGRVPRAKLLLLAPKGTARARTLSSWEAAGGERSQLVFCDAKPRHDYLAAYRSIDVCLDTFPYNGHTTSLDAYWMGVPTVTLVGDTVVGRAGLSLATNLGLPELVTRSPDEFVDRCLELTTDLERLAALRSSLRARLEASPLMDNARFARELEAAYRGVWRRYCEEHAGR